MTLQKTNISFSIELKWVFVRLPGVRVTTYVWACREGSLLSGMFQIFQICLKCLGSTSQASGVRQVTTMFKLFNIIWIEFYSNVNPSYKHLPAHWGVHCFSKSIHEYLIYMCYIYICTRFAAINKKNQLKESLNSLILSKKFRFYPFF